MKNTNLVSAAPASAKPALAVDEDRDSCYFPGCRKDANCTCKICIASINATLDLMPISVQKSSLTKLSTASNNVKVTPISFGSLSTPTSRSTRISRPAKEFSPKSARSSTRTDPSEKKKPRKTGKEPGFLRVVLVLVCVLGLAFVAEFGFSWGVLSGVVKPGFSRDFVRNIGERSWGVKGLDGKLKFLEKSLVGLVGSHGTVSNCSYADSKWEISQDGLLLNSHCKLYKSLMEEIRIWGWPLQTAGLLVSGISSRSFTVISGRVTEWSDGKVGYVTRKANTSWTHPKWGSSTVQFDPNTWILEYRRSSVMENPRLVSATMSRLKRRVSRNIAQMKQNFWLASSLGKIQYYSFGTESCVQVPT